MWGLPQPGSSAWALRLEDLALLLLVALSTGIGLRRLLTPWTGPAHARAAGWTCALFLMVHPLAPGAIASLEARPELVGLTLGSVAFALFLWGRQERRDGPVLASAAALALAGFGSGVALLFAFGLALAEFYSTQRHRPRARRARTASTTLLVFSLAALLPVLIARVRGESGPDFGGAPSGAGGTTLVRAIERLGQLFVPVQEQASGLTGVLLAGGLLCVALQPSLRATRSAPRLWGGLGLAWLVALGATLAWWSISGARGQGRELAAVMVMAAGMSVTITALSARRRILSGTLVALGMCGLAHANARPWLAAARAVESLHRDLALLELAPATRVLVLDPPRDVQGLDPLGDDLAWLLHPALLLERGVDASFDPGRAIGLSSAAFSALAHLPEFGELRRQPLTVLVPGTGGRSAHVLRPPSRSELPRSARSGQLSYTLEEDLDPLACEAVRVRAEVSTPAPELELLAWSDRVNERGSCAGVVREERGEHVALFDLSRSLDWNLGASVRRIALERSQGSHVKSWEFLERLPEPTGGGTPFASGDDWIFPLPAPGAEASSDAGRWVLFQLALSGYACQEIVLQRTEGGLRAPQAQLFSLLHARPDAPIAWSLDYRIGDLAVARLRGRSP